MRLRTNNPHAFLPFKDSFSTGFSKVLAALVSVLARPQTKILKSTTGEPQRTCLCQKNCPQPWMWHLLNLSVWSFMLCRDDPWDAAAGYQWGSDLGQETLCRTQYSTSSQTLPVLEEGDHPHFTELAHAECTAELLDWTPMFIYTGWKHLQSDIQTMW